MINNNRCGFVAIAGHANAGKSTLFNSVLGEELSIATHKPQTTRHNIRGILSLENCQLILIDTPGIQLGNKRLMSKVLMRNALSSLQDVDIILMLVELDQWNDEDEYLLNQIKLVNRPAILAINKVDKIKNKEKLLPIIKKNKTRHSFLSIIPLSALYDIGIDSLINELCKSVPESEFLFPEDIKWDRDDKFIISEVVRGSAILQLHKELPYAIYTEVEELEFSDELVTVGVIIWVEKESQKPIVIGGKGSKLKAIGEHARIKLEKIFGRKVMLNSWVKVKQSWQDQQDIVSQFEK